jgi:hypothetical protein
MPRLHAVFFCETLALEIKNPTFLFENPLSGKELAMKFVFTFVAVEVVALVLLLLAIYLVFKKRSVIIPTLLGVTAIAIGRYAPELCVLWGWWPYEYWDTWLYDLCTTTALILLALFTLLTFLDALLGSHPDWKTAGGALPTRVAGTGTEGSVVFVGIVAGLCLLVWTITDVYVQYFKINPRFESFNQHALAHNGIDAQLDPFIMAIEGAEMTNDQKMGPKGWDKEVMKEAARFGYDDTNLKIVEVLQVRAISDDAKRITHYIVAFNGSRKKDGALGRTAVAAVAATVTTPGTPALHAVDPGFEPLDERTFIIKLAPTWQHTNNVMDDLNDRYRSTTVDPAKRGLGPSSLLRRLPGRTDVHGLAVDPFGGI